MAGQSTLRRGRERAALNPVEERRRLEVDGKRKERGGRRNLQRVLGEGMPIARFIFPSFIDDLLT